MPLLGSVYARRTRLQRRRERAETRESNRKGKRGGRLTANTSSLYVLKWTPCNPPLYAATVEIVWDSSSAKNLARAAERIFGVKGGLSTISSRSISREKKPPQKWRGPPSTKRTHLMKIFGCFQLEVDTVVERGSFRFQRAVEIEGSSSSSISLHPTESFAKVVPSTS